MPRSSGRPPRTARRPPYSPRKPRVTPAPPPPPESAPTAAKTGWDKASVLVQAIGAFAIFVSVAALVVGVLQFNEQQRTSAAQLLDQQRQATLNGYLNDMSALVLRDNLTNSGPRAPVRAIAVARTATAVRGLDGIRKGELVRYLWEARLITTLRPVVNLAGVNLKEAVFKDANLYQVDLSSLSLNNANLNGAALDGANLSASDLTGADLNGSDLICLSHRSSDHETRACVNLSHAYLMDATLINANLSGANLARANLFSADVAGATLNGANLAGANLTGANLQGAKYNVTMIKVKNARGERVTEGPTRWPRGFDAKAAGAICVDC